DARLRRIFHAGNTIRIHYTVHARDVACHVEEVALSFGVVVRKVRLPTQARVQGELPVYLPGILRVECKVVLSVALLDWIRKRQSSHVSEDEISSSDSRR